MCFLPGTQLAEGERRTVSARSDCLQQALFMLDTIPLESHEIPEEPIPLKPELS